MAATLRAGPGIAFFHLFRDGVARIYLCQCIGLAHTLGEFGVVLMIKGNIPDETRVVSVQIYDHVEALDYARLLAAGGMIVLSFLILLLLYLTSDKAAVGSLQLRS